MVSDEEFRTVRVTMPLTVWGLMASKADIEQKTVGDIIADAIEAALGRRSAPPRPGRDPAPENASEPAEPVDLSDEGVRTRIRELHDQSWTGKAIARDLGVPYDRALVVLHQMGLIEPRKPKGTVDVALLRELHSQQMSDSKIAAAMNVSTEAVRVKRLHLGLPAVAKIGHPRTKTPPEPTKENHYS